MGARRKKSDQQVPGADIVPEYIRDASLLQRRKITKRKLPSYSEAMLLLHTPELQRRYFASLLAGLEKGDKVCIEQVGELFNFVKGKGINVSLTQQMIANNVAAGEAAPVMGYDALVRNIAEARAGHALPAPQVIEVRPADTVIETVAE